MKQTALFPNAATPLKTARFRLSYEFLLGHEQAGSAFTLEELATATGWKVPTIRTYLKKKWCGLVHKTSTAYRASGIGAYSADEFVRLMSQRQDVSADPRRPALAPAVEALVRKARESALLALHIYNSPTTIFRTEGFSVLMVIAWTSLLHATFEQQGQPYHHLQEDGVTPVLVDGDRKAWELDTCINKFWPGVDNPVRRNLEFFIKLRNKVEHRYVPSIDPHVAGECQALLLNFDELLTQQFGTYHAIRESLAVALQTTSVRLVEQSEAMRRLQAGHFDETKKFIDTYREGLPASVVTDPRFSFRVFLVPKTGNHRSSSDLAIEFVKFDPTMAADLDDLQRSIVAIKEKHVPVLNANLLKANAVVRQVASQLGKPFNLTHHARAWNRYQVRKPPPFDPAGCVTKYCVPDPLHQDFCYTQEWVHFLVAKLSDDREYTALTATRSTAPKVAPVSAVPSGSTDSAAV